MAAIWFLWWLIINYYYFTLWYKNIFLLFGFWLFAIQIIISFTLFVSINSSKCLIVLNILESFDVHRKTSNERISFHSLYSCQIHLVSFHQKYNSYSGAEQWIRWIIHNQNVFSWKKKSETIIADRWVFDFRCGHKDPYLSWIRRLFD